MATKKKIVVPPKIVHKPLPKKFDGRASQKEFSFKLIKREGDIAIYEKHDKEINHSYWETIIVQRHDGRMMPGNAVIPPAEFYPSDNMWGTYGWCCASLEAAEVHYQRLLLTHKSK